MSRVKAKVDIMYSVRITQELEDMVVKVAALEGRTKTNVIRHYLELGLKGGANLEQLEVHWHEKIPNGKVYDPEGFFN
jgi:predicted DNA-binding protein